MTEHEKRINESAIKAQQTNDLNGMPYKLPGIKRYGEERQDQYIEKSYGKVNQSVEYGQFQRREGSSNSSMRPQSLARSSSVGAYHFNNNNNNNSHNNSVWNNII